MKTVRFTDRLADAGEERPLPDAYADELIAKGLAEEVKAKPAPRSAKKKRK